MATLDLSGATQRVDMRDPDLVGFGAAEAATSTTWSFLTPAGHDLQLEGTGMTFNAQGRALSGAVSSIAIDLGNNDFDRPDVVITGIDAAAATLDDGPGAFWRFLEGDDTIIGPDAGAQHIIFGDGLAARAGSNTGGNDVFELGDSYVQVAGDVWTVGSQTAGTPTAGYRGGSDTILGGVTAEYQDLIGDAYHVYATGDLTGGDDTILTQTTRFGATAVGDAAVVEGIAGDLATVVGGNDVIAGGSLSQAFLLGDVHVQRAYSFVRGGDDIIKGSDANEYIIGDVGSVGDNQMIGGADRLWGGGGDDRLYGDFETVGGAGKATAGNDTIHGGAGGDTIFGDGTDDSRTTGGDDRLFGEAGNDSIVGGTGNDLLDGGAGIDGLTGGTGNDIYVIDHASDQANEEANEGIDTVRSHLGDVALWDNVENLIFIGTGNFTATGNALDNTIRGGAGADSLNGLGGNDRLHGGAGADMLFDDAGDDVLNGGDGGDQLVGGDGFDIASYAGSEQAVHVSLDGSVTATGDAVGDTFNTIEALEGTSFDDVLVGDGNANRLYGGDGDDALTGGGGNDKFIVNNAGDITNEAVGEGTADRVYASVSYQLAGNAEIEILNTASNGGLSAINLVGNNFAQTIIGNAGNNIINGLGGADTMSGLGGNDRFHVDNSADVVVEAIGGGTADQVRTSVNYSLKSGVEVEILSTTNAAGTADLKLAGNAFANTVAGNAGDNFINGAAGADTLTGLGGDDIFMFNTTLGGGNVDDITDFSVADDTIRLENGVFDDIIGTGTLTAAQFSANASGTAQDASDRIIYETDTGRLIYDANGSAAGGAVQFAQLDAGLAITNADFFIV